MKHNILSLDFWQDTAIYGGKSFPSGTLGCDALSMRYQKEKLPKENVILRCKGHRLLLFFINLHTKHWGKSLLTPVN